MEQWHKKIEAVEETKYKPFTLHPAEQTECRYSPISTSPAKQSQSKSTCKTQGLPEVVTSYDNVNSDVRKQEFPDTDALKIHKQSDMQHFSCYICKYIQGSEEYKQYLERQTKQPIEDVKQNKDKGISTSPAEQSQSKSICKTWGLPEIVTGYDNVSSDVCKQKLPTKDTLEIHMQSHIHDLCVPYASLTQ